MSWTNKLPKTKGRKYWRKDEKSKYGIYEIIDNYGDGVDLSCHVDDGLDSLDSMGGEWWDSPVPEPGTAFTVKETLDFITPYFTKGYSVLEIMHKFTDPKDGIAAVTTKGEK